MKLNKLLIMVIQLLNFYRCPTDELYYLKCVYYLKMVHLDSPSAIAHYDSFANIRDFTHNRFLLYTTPIKKLEDNRYLSIKSIVKIDRIINFVESKEANQLINANIAE